MVGPQDGPVVGPQGGLMMGVQGEPMVGPQGGLMLSEPMVAAQGGQWWVFMVGLEDGLPCGEKAISFLFRRIAFS